MKNLDVVPPEASSEGVGAANIGEVIQRQEREFHIVWKISFQQARQLRGTSQMQAEKVAVEAAQKMNHHFFGSRPDGGIGEKHQRNGPFTVHCRRSAI